MLLNHTGDLIEFVEQLGIIARDDQARWALENSQFIFPPDRLAWAARWLVRRAWRLSRIDWILIELGVPHTRDRRYAIGELKRLVRCGLLSRYLIGRGLRLSLWLRPRLSLWLRIGLSLGLRWCPVGRLAATTGFDLANSPFLIRRLPEHIDLVEELVGRLA